MNNNGSKIELVAPAGGPEQLIAAINGGADSVYLGYRKYGARAYAGNFSFNELRWAINKSHSSGKKVYLTLNTIIKNEEFSDLLNFLNNYLGLCRDGIIIQDMGLLKLLTDLFPDVPLHASTQMNVHNSGSLDLLDSSGIARAVLAREMTLDEIKHLSRDNGVDLEVFGHGSQCYSYSGICYFSSFTGGRSGNRGRCTQPCRMRYELVQSDGTKVKRLSKKPLFLLSKNDLNTLNILPLIIMSGVNALKIEGRMKTPEYVAIIVKTYRKYIDFYYDAPEKYHVREEDIFKIKQIFSRKLGTGYYISGSKGIVDPGRSGSVGNFMGRIKKVCPGRHNKNASIHIISKQPIRNGDIIEIWTKKGNKRVDVKDVDVAEAGNGDCYKVAVDDDKTFSPRDRVFKYFDKKIDEEAKSLYAYDSLKYKHHKKIGSGIHHSDKLKHYLKGHNIGADVPGGSLYKGNQKITLSLRVYSMKELEKALDTRTDNIIISGTDELINEAFAEDSTLGKVIKSRAHNKKIIIDTPHIIYDSSMERLQYTLESVQDSGLFSIRVSNLGVLEYLNRYKKKNGIAGCWSIRLGDPLNISNTLSAVFYHDYINNLEGWEFSPEIDRHEIEEIIYSFIKDRKEKYVFSVFAHGYFRVITARHMITCADKGNIGDGDIFLEDRKKYRFRVAGDGRDNTGIYNSKKICTLFDLDSIVESGINDLVIDSLFSSGFPETIKVINSYRNALSMITSGRIDDYREYVKKLESTPLFRDYSRGHLFRGVE